MGRQAAHEPVRQQTVPNRRAASGANHGSSQCWAACAGSSASRKEAYHCQQSIYHTKQQDRPTTTQTTSFVASCLQVVALIHYDGFVLLRYTLWQLLCHIERHDAYPGHPTASTPHTQASAHSTGSAQRTCRTHSKRYATCMTAGMAPQLAAAAGRPAPGGWLVALSAHLILLVGSIRLSSSSTFCSSSSGSSRVTQHQQQCDTAPAAAKQAAAVRQQPHSHAVRLYRTFLCRK